MSADEQGAGDGISQGDDDQDSESSQLWKEKNIIDGDYRTLRKNYVKTEELKPIEKDSFDKQYEVLREVALDHDNRKNSRIKILTQEILPGIKIEEKSIRVLQDVGKVFLMQLIEEARVSAQISMGNKNGSETQLSAEHVKMGFAKLAKKNKTLQNKPLKKLFDN